MRRFSLRSLLVGIAIASVLLATAVPLVKAFYVAPQAERNLASYRLVSGSLIGFIDRHGRWPRDEQELMDFAYEGIDAFDRREEPFERAVVAYDFDFQHDSLASQSFRGLRYRYPIDAEIADAVRDELLTHLIALRDGDPPPTRYLTFVGNPIRKPSPVSVGPASPNEAEEASAGDEARSREADAAMRDAARK